MLSGWVLNRYVIDGTKERMVGTPKGGLVSVPVALEDDDLKGVPTCQTERGVHVSGAAAPGARPILSDGKVSLLAANDHPAGIYSMQRRIDQNFVYGKGT